MLSFVRKHHRLVFFIAWFTINILQAGFTELIDDEAYYWVYSQFPAWGYFDHPPMIALLIRAGYALFPAELGVRFFIVLLNTATIFIVQQLTEKKDDRLFYAITGSIAVAQIGGIIAVPDIPLIFFVALFFLLYRRFLSNSSIVNSLLLGLAMALMLYSKYHGVLIIAGTLFSNPSLFRKYQSYIAALFALLLFVPHLYWQYQHDFPSIQYHLFERNASHYRVNFTIEYIAGQIALAGPLMGWLLLWAAFKYKTASLSERAMKFSLIGLYGFFLFSTLKGRVEANWTIPAFISLIALSHQYLREDDQLRKWLYKSLPIALVMIFLARVYMISALPSIGWLSKDDEIHQNRTWAHAVEEQAAGLPVVFTNSYQKASKYWFYSGHPAMSMNGVDYRRNNYNFWPLEDSVLGKKVLVAGRYDTLVLKNFLSGTDSIGTTIVAPYYSFTKMQIRFADDPLLENNLLSVAGEIRTPAHYLPFFQAPPYDTASVILSVSLRGEKPVNLPTGFTVKQIHQQRQSFRLLIPIALPPGEYTGRLGISTAIPLNYSLNSTSFPLEIK